MIITLYNSTPFENVGRFWLNRLSLDGHVVVEPRGALDESHKQQVEVSDIVFLIDEWKEDNSTAAEIAYATERGKLIYRSSRTCPHPICGNRFTQTPPCEVCRGY